MIRILHFDDRLEHHKLIRGIISNLCADVVFDYADSVFQAKGLINSNDYHCVITDQYVAENGGIGLLKLVRKNEDKPPFILLLEEGFEQEFLKMNPEIDTFRNVYLSRFASFENLARQISEISSREYDPNGTAFKSEDVGPFAINQGQMFEKLTQREMEILKHLALGHSNKVIAQKLDISYKTVLNHVNNLYQKLNVNNRLEAAHLAIKARLIEIE